MARFRMGRRECYDAASCLARKALAAELGTFMVKCPLPNLAYS